MHELRQARVHCLDMWAPVVYAGKTAPTGWLIASPNLGSAVAQQRHKVNYRLIPAGALHAILKVRKIFEHTATALTSSVTVPTTLSAITVQVRLFSLTLHRPYYIA